MKVLRSLRVIWAPDEAAGLNIVPAQGDRAKNTMNQTKVRIRTGSAVFRQLTSAMVCTVRGGHKEMAVLVSPRRNAQRTSGGPNIFGAALPAVQAFHLD